MFASNPTEGVCQSLPVRIVLTFQTAYTIQAPADFQPPRPLANPQPQQETQTAWNHAGTMKNFKEIFHIFRSGSLPSYTPNPSFSQLFWL